MIDKPKTDPERDAIVSALDQLNQTMEVMQRIIGRLQRSVAQADKQAQLNRQLKREGQSSKSFPQSESDGGDKPRGKVPVLH